ncbi:DNA-processing protein DprA [Gordonia sp. NPDC003376]
MTGPVPSAADEREARAWAYLAAVAEPPCGPVRDLVAELGPVEAARAIRARSVPDGHTGVLEPTAARAGADVTMVHLERAHGVGARLITPDDDEWPAWPLLPLRQATRAAKAGEPLALWVRGPGQLDAASVASVAMVGARASTTYGDHVAAELTGDLVTDSWTVISGAAFGIDAAAHRAALAGRGETVAVLACGIDRDYPAAHSTLLTDIARTGLVVTEYPPGTTAAKHRFLARNRLVAALASAVVVVEAGRRSGALNTAAWARRLNRPLGAVPGPINSATSLGCHAMIADGDAVLIQDADDIVRLVHPDGGGVPTPGRPRSTDGLTDDQLQVVEALPPRGALGIDEIVFVSGRPVSVVRTALAVLDLKGLVEQDDQGWRLVR